MVALPGMTALLIVNLAFGVMSRAAPTLNLFAIGFPVTLIFGLVIVWAGLPAVQTTFIESLEQVFELMRALLAGGR
jgi:flagellar biosynthesis protein FliR